MKSMKEILVERLEKYEEDIRLAQENEDANEELDLEELDLLEARIEELTYVIGLFPN